MTYRPALDGVRAVAVLAVIAYHVAPDSASGGFLGVDVFFVLSGYLITGLLLDEHARTGRISMPRFWARRARRLLPAVLVLVAVTAVVVQHVSPIASLPERRDDLLGTLFYYANWHFIASDQSYFASYAGASPLRHTWSLAIEEQFYLVWPLLLVGLMFLARGRRRLLLAVIVAGIAVSAVELALAYDTTNPSRSYFGTDSRAYTLLVGAALALLLRGRAQPSAGRAKQLATWACVPIVLAVAAAFLVVSDQSRYYYWGGALVFSLVVAAALWSVETAPRSIVGAALSLRSVRWIGMISYGLYLWHWPMLLWLSGSPRLSSLSGRERQLAEVAATFAAATASFYLLERPVRTGRVPWLRSSIRRLVPVVAVAVASVAALVIVQTRPDADRALAQQLVDFSDADCPQGPNGRVWCVRTGAGEGDRLVVAVIGDSTSRALNPGMLRVARARGWRYIQGGAGGCSFVPLVFPLDTEADNVSAARRCPERMSRIRDDIQTTMHPDVWVVADRFSLLSLLTADDELLRPGDPRRARMVEEAMTDTFRRLTAGGSKVVLIATPPRGQPLECATKHPAPVSCAEATYTVKDQPTAALHDVMSRSAAQLPGRVVLVEVTDLLCPDGVCRPLVDGRLARYDGVHYTASFSRIIVPKIIERAEKAGVTFERR
jgi:peptidoglycan/LPS O-acetylase OafA/YrhL